MLRKINRKLKRLEDMPTALENLTAQVAAVAASTDALAVTITTETAEIVAVIAALVAQNDAALQPSIDALAAVNDKLVAAAAAVAAQVTP
jgi:hypothetical protein